MMNTDKTLALLNTLLSQSTKKSEIKVFNRFVRSLSSMKKKELTQSQLVLIEEKLTALDLKSTSNNKKSLFETTCRIRIISEK